MRSTPEHIHMPAEVYETAKTIYALMTGQRPNHRSALYTKARANPEEALIKLKQLGLGEQIVRTTASIGSTPNGKDLIFLAIARAQWMRMGTNLEAIRPLEAVLEGLNTWGLSQMANDTDLGIEPRLK